MAWHNWSGPTFQWWHKRKEHRKVMPPEKNIKPPTQELTTKGVFQAIASSHGWMNCGKEKEIQSHIHNPSIICSRNNRARPMKSSCRKFTNYLPLYNFCLDIDHIDKNKRIFGMAGHVPQPIQTSSCRIRPYRRVKVV